MIPSGSSFVQVADTLIAAGVITDKEWFGRLAEQKKYKSRVRPGRYVIPSGTSMNEPTTIPSVSLRCRSAQSTSSR